MRGILDLRASRAAAGTGLVQRALVVLHRVQVGNQRVVPVVDALRERQDRVRPLRVVHGRPDVVVQADVQRRAALGREPPEVLRDDAPVVGVPLALKVRPAHRADRAPRAADEDRVVVHLVALGDARGIRRHVRARSELGHRHDLRVRLALSYDVVLLLRRELADVQRAPIAHRRGDDRHDGAAGLHLSLLAVEVDPARLRALLDVDEAPVLADAKVRPRDRVSRLEQPALVVQLEAVRRRRSCSVAAAAGLHIRLVYVVQIDVREVPLVARSLGHVVAEQEPQGRDVPDVPA